MWSLSQVQELVCKFTVAAGGGAHLRLCSRLWKAVNDANINRICCDANELAGAIPFMQRLQKIEHLTIRGNKVDGSMPGSTALCTFGVKLTSLTLDAGHDSREQQDWISSPSTALASFSSLLLPWKCSITKLNFINCVVSSCGTNDTFNSPGFFANFPLLTDLVLHGVRILSSLDLVGCATLETLDCSSCNLRSLDVMGCKQLLSLDCHGNLIRCLSLSGCTTLINLDCSGNCCTLLDLSECHDVVQLLCTCNSLVQLDVACCKQLEHLQCQGNMLSSLDLTACRKLKHIDCSHNHLQTLFLHAEAQLVSMALASNLQGVLVFGGASVSIISCDAATFRSVSPAVCAEVQKLHLEGTVRWDLGRFQRLQSLSCTIGHRGSIDLSGCQNLELVLHSKNPSLAFFGRSSVRKLSLSGSWSLTDFTRFTALRELDYFVSSSELQALDLSACRALHKVFLWNTGPCGISAVNFAGCVSLEELDCQGMMRLAELDLSSCASLTVLNCVGSGLTSLDISCCPLLKRLDVSDSELLLTINTGSLGLPQCFKDSNCPKLPGALSGKFS